MNDPFHITDFLDPVDIGPASLPDRFREGQIGRYVDAYEGEMPSFAGADIVLLGCGERRGDLHGDFDNAGPDAIRRQFYSLYHWNRHIRIADAGNIRRGATLADTYAALRSVVSEIRTAGAKAVILGGGHDLTLGQYEVYRASEKIIEATVIDSHINLSIDIPVKSSNYLMEMLTGEPNFIRHYNHIGFQSYLVHPNMLETMDKLRFDCFRLGHVREAFEEMEPVIRQSNMVSFDIAAMQYSAAPVSAALPNGFNGEEACTLMYYCGLSQKLDTLGLYGYDAGTDVHELAAKQMAQMIWYFMDGIRKGMTEAPFSDSDSFTEFHTVFAEVDTVFLQSRKTGRWWMRMPDGTYIACSYRDYTLAGSNEIPERWLRAQERG
jgi:arginase family enzyme